MAEVLAAAIQAKASSGLEGLRMTNPAECLSRKSFVS
jgi:hypothetical protein